MEGTERLELEGNVMCKCRVFYENEIYGIVYELV